MKKSILLFVVCLGGLLLSTACAEKVSYVKPTVPTTECPSGDSPCHSLQYYANHSSFTNNSRFLFLEGEHHLDSVVTISNMANLSLVGAGSGVEILCVSLPSGFHIEEFVGVKIENMVISNCNVGPGNAFEIVNGSEVTIDHVTLSNCSGYDCTGLWAEEVVGSFSILNSIFTEINGVTLRINYSFCKLPTILNLTNNTLNTVLSGCQPADLYLGCSNIYTVITDIQFGVESLQGQCGLDITPTCNNSVVIRNFRVPITITVNKFEKCTNTCAYGNVEYPGLHFDQNGIGNGTVLIENSRTVDLNFGPLIFIQGNNGDARCAQVILRNITLANNDGYPAILSLDGATVLLIDCTFQNNTGSAIEAVSSKIFFNGTNIFSYNSGYIGGGVILLESFMYLMPHTHVVFENNQANYRGGAIYIRLVDQCFFKEVFPNSTDTIRVTFISNTAGFAGASIYGGISWLCDHFQVIFNVSNTEDDPSAIASEPSGVCLCEESKHQPNCSDLEHSIQAYPGQEFSIRLAVVSDLPLGSDPGGVVPGIIIADLSEGNATLEPSQKFQATNVLTCTNLSYSLNTMFVDESNVSLDLRIANPFSPKGSITVDLMECPLGFPLSPTLGKCQCDSHYDMECNVNNMSFWRSANSRTWIGFIDKSSNASNKPGVMYHPNCPIGYCSRHDVNITSNTSDNQCEPHRTGLLCGECEEGYSLTLGDGKCVQCSNTYLLLILPLALSGLFLVTILFALNLTVTEGSINGLIFYANVIAMNRAVLLSGETSYLYIFLAWINLDIGISTCLFNGMDAYSEIWLQFVFPVYLWVIILVIIQFYRKYPSLAIRLGGLNAVKVLATLLLLSYTKLQRTVVTILSFTTLEYPDGTVQHVWLYDANVEFFTGRHLYLGIAGILVLVFLIVPYTLCLAFFQQLQACSGHRLFQWVNKLKPVFDSYAGPYKDKYRFWTGMLLVARTLLLILFTTNTEASIDFSSLIIFIVSGFLLLANTNGTYKKLPCNFLESFFYLQLVVFAGSLLYVNNNHGNIKALADTSFGLSLVVFLAVLGYHSLHWKSIKTRYYRLKGYDNLEASFDHERRND